MSETTKSERIAWRKEAKDPKTEFTHEERHGILNLVDDADRLAAIERRVTYICDHDLQQAWTLTSQDIADVRDKLRAIIDPPDQSRDMGDSDDPDVGRYR